MDEVSDLVVSSTQLSVLGMTSMEDATEKLTAVLKGFKMEAQEVSEIVDKLTKLDLDYATSASDIGTALSKMAAVARSAGMSLDSAAAAVTTVIDVTQAAPESVGTAFQTILTRFGNVKPGAFLDETEGVDTEGINDTEKVLGAIGISIRDSQMEMRDFEDVLDDLSEKWVSLTDVERNAISSAMAGTRQRNMFLSLMDNYDSYKKAIEIAETSTGTANEKYEAYMESIEAHLNQLKDAWDALVQKVEASDIFKFLIDGATKLVEILPYVLRAFTTLFATINAYKLPVWLKQIGSAVNPFRATAFGKFKGLGLDKSYTRSGQQQRAAIRNYEYYKSIGDEAKMKEAAEKLPQGYKDKYLKADGVDDGNAKVVSELEELNSSAKVIERAVTGKPVPGAPSDQSLQSDAAEAAAEAVQEAAEEAPISEETLSEAGGQLLEVAESATSEVTTSPAKDNIPSLMGPVGGHQHALNNEIASGASEEQIAQRRLKLEQARQALAEARYGTNVKELSTQERITQEISEQNAVEQQNLKLGQQELNNENQIAAAQERQVVAANQENAAETQGVQISAQENRIENATLVTQNSQVAAQGAANAAATQGNMIRASGVVTNATGGVVSGATGAAGTAATGTAAAGKTGILSKIGGFLSKGSMGKSIPIIGGLVSGVTAGVSQEGPIEDKLVKGGISAGVTGAMSAIPYVGAIIGPIFGPMLGDWLGDLAINAMHAEENARKLRVETAKKELEFLEGMTDSVEQGMETFLKNTEDMTAEDYKTQQEVIESMRSSFNNVDDEETEDIDESEFSRALEEEFLNILNSNLEEGEAAFESYNDALEELENNTERASDVMLAYSAAQKLQTARAQEAANEQEKYEIREKIGEAEKERNRAEEGSKEWEEANDKVLNYQAQLDSIIKEEREGYLEAAFESSGVSGMSALDISASSLGFVRQKLLSEWVKEVPEILLPSGDFSSEAVSTVDRYLRQDENLSSLFSSGNLTVGEVFDKNTQTERDDILKKFKEAGVSIGTFQEAMDLAAKGDEESIAAIEAAADKMGMSVDEFRNKIFRLDPSNRQNFSNSLGLSNGYIESHFSALENLNLDTFLGGMESLNEKYSELSDIFADLATDMKLTQENISKIVEKYPYLMKGEDGKFSQDNILGNLLEVLMGGENSEAGLAYGATLMKKANSESSYWNMFRESYGENDWKEIFGEGLTQDQLNLLNREDVAFNDVLKDSNLVNRMNENGGFDKWKEMVTETVADYELIDQLEESIYEWQKHTYQEQIDNLQSIIDSLDDVNEARQKELDLIKAKDALENAQKEKKLVWREGVGWSYMADQTAIQEAQQNLEELKTQQDQENLQYQIDQYQKLIDMIDNRDEEEELRSFREIFTKWSEQMGIDMGEDGVNGYLSRIMGFFDKDFQEKTMRAIVNAQQEDALQKQIQDEETAIANVAAAKQNFDKAASNEFLDEKYKGSFEYSEAIKNYNKYLEEYQSAIDSAKEIGLSKEEIFDRINSYNQHIENGDSGYEGLKKITESIENLRNDYEKIPSYQLKEEVAAALSAGVAFVGEDAPGSNSYTASAGLSNGTKLTNTGEENYVLNGIFDESGIYEADQAFLDKQFGKIKHAWILPYNTGNHSYKGSTWEKIENSQYKDSIKSASDLTKLPKYTLILNLDWADYAMFVGSDGKLYKVYNNKGSADNFYEYNDGIQNRYASGTTSASGGLSMVNELGTEGIITPQGTLTSLPSRTGVVPADITKNLWALGEVAPNLVRNLDSITSKFPEGSLGSSDDHSTNINNLYATFQADENFDFDEFLIDVRGVIGTTRHSTG